MPYLSNDDLQNLHSFYTNPNLLTYAIFWNGLKYREEGFDYGLHQLRKKQMLMLADQQKKSSKELDELTGDKAEEAAAQAIQDAIKKMF